MTHLSNKVALPVKAGQDTVHQPLEGGGSTAQAKWHHAELKQSLSGTYSTFFLSSGCTYFYLPVPTCQIQGGEDAGFCECVQSLMGNWMSILSGHTC